MSYCTALGNMSETSRPFHQKYHDTQYGFQIDKDDELFARLVLEINQAGLSWETILKKEQGFRKAYDKFSIKKVAAYKAADRNRLMNDAGVIRNRLKINAAIENAKTILQLQNEYGSFKNWIEHHHPLTREDWTKLFKKTFKFTGGEIVNEFLMSTGVLPGAHDKTCPIYKKALRTRPLWNTKK